MLLQVHDELLLEVPEAEAGAVQALLPEVMESVVTLAVPSAGRRQGGPRLGRGLTGSDVDFQITQPARGRPARLPNCCEAKV